MTIQSTDLLWNKLAQTLLDGENRDDDDDDDDNEQEPDPTCVSQGPTCVRMHSPFLLEERTKMLKQLGKFIKEREFDIGADDVAPLVQMSAPLTGSQAVHAVLGAQLFLGRL